MDARLFRLKEKDHYNYDVLKLVLESPDILPEIPISSHIYIYNDENEYRPYTPLKAGGRDLHMAIKVYNKGKVSSYLSSLPLGSFVRVSDFLPRKRYVPNEHKDVLLICGGTGVTPMFQLLSHVLSSDKNMTKYTLLFFNKTEEDIFIKNELEKLCRNDKFRVVNVITRKIKKTGHSGDLITEKIREIIKENNFDYFYSCGTPGFMEVVSGTKTKDLKQGEISGVLKELGFSMNEVHKF